MADPKIVKQKNRSIILFHILYGRKLKIILSIKYHKKYDFPGSNFVRFNQIKHISK